MPELYEDNDKKFMIEKIKERPLNKTRLVRRTLVTAVMAVIFGLIACVTFILLGPVISNWIYPEEEKNTPPVLFPEDQEEMSPEEMLADAMHAEKQKEDEQNAENIENAEGSEEIDQEQIDKILEGVKLDLQNYQELYTALSGYIAELNRYMVTVTGFDSSVDWLNNETEDKIQSWGVLVAENEQEFYVLTDYDSVKEMERLTVTFNSGITASAEIRQYDAQTELAVLIVDSKELPVEEAESIEVAVLGSSFISNMAGTPVIALGSPMGINGSVGYGILTSPSVTFSAVDATYRLLQTDICGSREACGVLFNMRHEIIGVITDNGKSDDLGNLISAYGISELKKMIAKLSNSDGTQLPYLGITVLDMSKEFQSASGISAGAYVAKIEKSSPMIAGGLQQGDIITSINDQKISSAAGYSTTLINLNAGQELKMTVLRQSQGEYREMTLNGVTGGTGLGE